MTFDPTLAVAILEGRFLVVGDRMRFSGELLNQIADDTHKGSVYIVKIAEIHQRDGFKELVLQREELEQL